MTSRIERACITTLVVLVRPAGATAQQLHPVDVYVAMQQAHELYRTGKPEDAATAFARLTEHAAWDGKFWFEYGVILRQLGQRREAAAAWEKTYALGFTPRPELAILIAELHARLGEKEQALTWLETGLAHFLADRQRLQRDSAFLAYHGEPRFARISGMAKTKGLTRTAGWQLDVDFLVMEAKRLHASFDREAFSAAFAQAARTLRARIARLTDAEIFMEMRKLLALLKDGHSNVHPDPNAPRLPVDLYFFRDGLFVVDGSGEGEPLIASRVVAIGGKSVDSLLRGLAAYTPKDNGMQVRWLAPNALTLPIALHALGAAPDSTQATFTVQRDNQPAQIVTLHTVKDRPAMRKLRPPRESTDTVPLYLQKINRGAAAINEEAVYYWFAPLPSADAVYFQFNQIVPMQSESIQQFASRLQRALREGNAKNLIVDVRHNNGGDSFLFAPLLRVIIWFEQDDADHRIYYIMGRNTFSAAQNFTTEVEQKTNAILVGEPSSSRPNFTGEEWMFKLPYSQTTANVSFRYNQRSDWLDDRVWIPPHVPVELTSDDYFRNRDPALEAVLELIRRNAKGPER